LVQTYSCAFYREKKENKGKGGGEGTAGVKNRAHRRFRPTKLRCSQPVLADFGLETPAIQRGRRKEKGEEGGKGGKGGQFGRRNLQVYFELQQLPLASAAPEIVSDPGIAKMLGERGKEREKGEQRGR